MARRSYEEVNGKVGTGPPIDSDGLAQQTTGDFNFCPSTGLNASVTTVDAGVRELQAAIAAQYNPPAPWNQPDSIKVAGTVDQVAAHQERRQRQQEEAEEQEEEETEQQMVAMAHPRQEIVDMPFKLPPSGLSMAMSNTGSSMTAQFAGQAVQGQEDRIALGYKVDGSPEGPYSQENPPPGMRFAGYNKGCAGIVWATTYSSSSHPSASVMNRIFAELLPSGDASGLSQLIEAGTIAVDLRMGKGPNKDNTLLHWAAKRGQADVVRMLLGHGADRSLKDLMARTPLELAKEEGHTEAANLIRGADGDGWKPARSLEADTRDSEPATTR